MRMAQLFLLIKNERSSYGALINDPDVPRRARWLIGVALTYLLNPFDIIPDFVPIIGLLDDVIIVGALLLLARALIPADVRIRQSRLRSSHVITNSVGDNK